MATLKIRSAAGRASGNVEVDDGLFDVEPNVAVMHQVVTAQLAARRAGTQSTKTRADVRGGGAKPWRQKGTGRARQGTIRAPHFTGGGMAFPPNNRNFDSKVNRKARKAALRSALSAHAQGETIGVLEASGFDAPSTKAAVELLGSWGKDLPVLVVAQPEEEALIKSFRNLDRVVVTVPAELEVHHVVWARSLLVSEGALEQVQGRAS